jgi:signal transduction histidine kinase
VNPTRAVVRDLAPLIAAMAAGLAATLAIASAVLGFPAPDVRLLAVYLAISGVGSLAIGLGVLRLAPAFGFGGLQARIVVVQSVVLLMIFIDISATAWLMFLSAHDLGLLALLLFFSGVVSLGFAGVIAGQISRAVRQLAAAAGEVAGGRLGARVRAEGTDEVAELGRAFNTMAARLDEADRARREMEEARRHLIVAVSHDLRTPIASVRAMVEAMNDRVVTDSETIDRYLQAMHGEMGRLSSLIDDLFELSQLDAGALRLHLEPGSLRDLLSDTLESLRPQALARGLRLSGHVDSDLPPVLMDAARIQRVLDNLIQNAIRHTPPQGTIILEAQDEDDTVRVDVVDSGEGVPPSDLPHIFESFYRGEKSRARGQGGAGLGLAIARGIIEAHGGKIWAQNLPGRGTRFSFVLPKAL